MRVSEDTYKMVIKMRGIFEQLFKRKLSLDDTVYLSARLISFIYEAIQKLAAQGQIKIVELGDGSLKLERLINVASLFPVVIAEFTEIDQKLAEKEKKTSRLMVTTKT